jgi:multiple sugar transport system ATP-binding protein
MADVSFSHVKKVFPDGTTAVHDLTLDIGDGELLVLVGPSGCGKTTVLRMVAGLVDVSEGEIRVGGRLVARVLGLEAELDRKPRQLSGGQRQRVAMGRAIVRQPQVFLMDEPLSNLDASLRFQMRAEVASLQHRVGVTTIYVTHDQVEAMTIGNRVAVMRRGELVQLGDPQEIYDRPADLFIARFIGSPPMNLIEGTLKRDGRYAVSLGAREIPLDAQETADGAAFASYVGRPVVVGLRPEQLEDAGVAGDVPPERRLGGVVTLRETLGSDVLVHFEVDGARPLSGRVRAAAVEAAVDPVELEPAADEPGLLFIGRFDPRSRIRLQDRVEAAVRPGAIQLFDPETGAAIGP